MAEKLQVASIRPATRIDFVAFYGREPPMTMRALVAESTAGELLAFGGYHRADGVAIAFADSRDELGKRDRVRGARALVDMLKKLGIEVVATVTDEAGERAARHFGFEPWGQFWRLTP